MKTNYMINSVPLYLNITILMYVVESKSFRPDIQKARQMEIAVRGI